MKKIEQEITKKLQEEKKRSSETEDHEKQRLATPKRLLEKVVASKHPRLAVETEEVHKKSKTGL